MRKFMSALLVCLAIAGCVADHRACMRGYCEIGYCALSGPLKGQCW